MFNFDRSKLYFILSCAFVLFIYGVAVGRYQIFPFAILRYAQDSVEQVIDEIDTLFGIEPTHFLNVSLRDGQGITVFKEENSVPGLTLIEGFFDNNSEIRLVNRDGSLVKRWTVRFSEFFPDPSHIHPRENIPRTDWNIDTHGALINPDGSVVFNFEYGGTVKLDRCGSVVWVVPLMTHHSISRAADGHYWIPGRQYIDGRSQFPPLKTPYYEDTILKISSEGEVLEEISVPKIIFDNNLHALLFASGQNHIVVPETEIVHLNDIEELTAELARVYPLFDAGDLMLSLRELNLIMVVEPSTRRVKWRQTGPWIRQHDPDFTSDGRIIVFNNNMDDSGGSIFGGSNILELDPNTGNVEVVYPSTVAEPFYTAMRGKQQILAGGNLLVTDFEGGRVFEVNRKGEIVWEFINRYSETSTAEVTSALRYPEEYFVVDDWSCE